MALQLSELIKQKALFISQVVQRPCLFLDLETSHLIPPQGLILEIGAIYAHWGYFHSDFRVLNETIPLSCVPTEKILPEAIQVNKHDTREKFTCNTVQEFTIQCTKFFQDLPQKSLLVGKYVTTFDFPWLCEHLPDVFSFNRNKSTHRGFIEVTTLQNIFPAGPYREKSPHNAIGDIFEDINFLSNLFTTIQKNH